MADDNRLSGPAAHMVLVRIRGELFVAVARVTGIEIRSVADNQVVGVLDPEVAVSALAACAVAPQTDRLLTGGPDGVLRDYDLERLLPVARVDLGDAVQSIAVVRCGEETVVAVVHRTGVAIVTVNPTMDLTRDVERLNWDATTPASAYQCCAYEAFGSRWLAVSLADSSLMVWRLGLSGPDAGGSLVSILPEAHQGQIWAIVGTQTAGSEYAVATGSADGSVTLWKAHAGGLEPARTLKIGSTVRAMAMIAADDPMLVTAAASGEVAMWRLSGAADRPVRVVTQHLGEAWALAATATDDGGVVVASGDMHGLTQIARLRLDLIDERTAFVLHQGRGTIWTAAAGETADGPYIAIGGVDHAVRVLDPRRIRVPQEMRGHVATVRSMASAGTASDPHLITGGADLQVLDWNPVNGRLNREVPMQHQGEVWAIVTYAWGGRTFVATGSADGSVRICPLDGDEVVTIDGLGAVSALVVSSYRDDVRLTASTTRGIYVISAVTGDIAARVLDMPHSALCGVFDGVRQLVVTARPDDDVRSLIEVVEPRSGRVLTGERHIVPASISALSAERIDDTVMIVGGSQDGRLLVWQLDGTLVSRPVDVGRSAIRAVGFTPLGPADSTAVYATDGQGQVVLLPVAAGDLVRTGGLADPGLAPAAILVDDQPSTVDMLARDSLVDTIADVLLAANTRQPMVLGLHAPWGHGKSTVLRLLRARLDPAGAVGSSDPRTPRPPTHRLRALPGNEVGRLRAWWQRGVVRTRLSRAWAWKQAMRARGEGGALGFEMVPEPAHRQSAITVWFNPWMYQTAEQIWAGLAREILSEISDRLPRAQRERLWFDLNLRRTDPLALRKRIMASYLPKTLSGLALAAAIGAVVVVALSAVAITTVQSVNMPAIVGTGGVIVLAVLGFLARMAKSGYEHFNGWLAPETLTRPAARGVGAPSEAPSDWRPAGDPMDASQQGYLYLVQHDIAEVMRLAGEHTPIVLFIDDLDRCGPRLVAEVFEALNLFLNNAFGPAHCLIAFDSEMVAAQLGAYYGASPAHANWRFMEKMVDLPVRLPRVRDAAISSYLDSVMDRFGKPVRRSAPASFADSGGTVPLDRAGPATGAGPVAEEVMSSVDEGGGERLADYLESLPPVRQALRDALMALPGRSPRQAKAVLNLWRFYMVLEYRGGNLSSRLTAMEAHSLETARFVELLVRWPWLLDRLSRTVRISSVARRFVFEELIDAAGDDERWTRAATASGLDADDLDVLGLRDLLSRPGDAALLAAIGARYL